MQMQSKEPLSAFPGWDGFSELSSYTGLGFIFFFFFLLEKQHLCPWIDPESRAAE